MPDPNLPQTSRLFTPTLRSMACPTKLLRLEFDSRQLDYYAELDAVSVIGDRVITMVRVQFHFVQCYMCSVGADAKLGASRRRRGLLGVVWGAVAIAAAGSLLLAVSRLTLPSWGF